MDTASLSLRGPILAGSPEEGSDPLASIAFARPLHALVASAILAGVGAAQSPTTVRVSVDSHGAQGNAASGLYGVSVSADGRYVAFESVSDNLVPGDTNGVDDVFVRDRQSGQTERVSVDSSGVQGNGRSNFPSISADGRYVAFWSLADNLVSGDTNGAYDVFVHDRQSGQTERVSVDSSGAQANNSSFNPSISGDGRYVAFQSYADDLVPGDANGFADVFVRDRQSGTTEIVSVATGGAQGDGISGAYRVSISSDGHCVAFESLADDLVAGDTNGAYDVFVHDRQTGQTERVSVDSNGVQGNGISYVPSISGDGRYVAFYSFADNLIPGDTPGREDCFVNDRQSGATEIVSVSASGVQGNGGSDSPSISADGRYVAFASTANNLVHGDTNGFEDVFVHDRQSHWTERVSVDSSGVQGDGHSYLPSISADGRHVAFLSAADDLVPGDTNAGVDSFLRDRGFPPPDSYCTAKIDSIGCAPAIGSSGTASIGGADNFYVTASNVLNNKRGMMLWSRTAAGTPFQGGTLCVATPFVRTPLQNSEGSVRPVNDCSGVYSFHFTQTYMARNFLGAGSEVFAQYWSRDPGFAPPDDVGLTDALHFVIAP
jgi:Tol biopolymer transport system component